MLHHLCEGKVYKCLLSGKLVLITKIHSNEFGIEEVVAEAYTPGTLDTNNVFVLNGQLVECPETFIPLKEDDEPEDHRQ